MYLSLAATMTEDKFIIPVVQLRDKFQGLAREMCVRSVRLFNKWRVLIVIPLRIVIRLILVVTEYPREMEKTSGSV
ncbi:hypothetical protein [Dehalococcoides mccartyi]|uniref:Uncharacterized protein n=1 Tax=Dehalococcoides mccartyi (strain VS) TaxID=311424 RepID=D2BIY7_DEHMV|nr:hypothetical protein [Dehalococcoides mccartyi]ACZ62287.1 hypothetical protein DhcVS_1175 [Dehalococcoides mccartyi VS]